MCPRALGCCGIGVEGRDAIPLDRGFMWLSTVDLLGLVAVGLFKQGGVKSTGSSEGMWVVVLV